MQPLLWLRQAAMPLWEQQVLAPLTLGWQHHPQTQQLLGHWQRGRYGMQVQQSLLRRQDV